MNVNVTGTVVVTPENPTDLQGLYNFITQNNLSNANVALNEEGGYVTIEVDQPMVVPA